MNFIKDIIIVLAAIIIGIIYGTILNTCDAPAYFSFFGSSIMAALILIYFEQPKETIIIVEEK